MAVREFTDDDGRDWRAWDIRPEAIHPVTKAEDYLADCYITGWIVFETKTGDEKRRLCPWPIRWTDSPDEELRELLHGAEIVPPHRVRSQRVVTEQRPRTMDEIEALVAADEPDITDLQVVRTFRYPGGRFWTVSVVNRPESGGPAVLRFTAGMRSIDLRRWPRDWADQPDDTLVGMLRRGAPRPRSTPPGPATPRRRWDDSPISPSSFQPNAGD